MVHVINHAILTWFPWGCQFAIDRKALTLGTAANNTSRLMSSSVVITLVTPCTVVDSNSIIFQINKIDVYVCEKFYAMSLAWVACLSRYSARF